MRLMRGEVRFELAFDHPAADDIGIHAGAADVLAHLINDEHINIFHRQARHELAGLLQQALIALDDRIRGEAFEMNDSVITILDDAEAGDEVDAVYEMLGDDGHVIAQADRRLLMNGAGAGLLAQADREHFEQDRSRAGRGNRCGLWFGW